MNCYMYNNFLDQHTYYAIQYNIAMQYNMLNSKINNDIHCSDKVWQILMLRNVLVLCMIPMLCVIYFYRQ